MRELFVILFGIAFVSFVIVGCIDSNYNSIKKSIYPQYTYDTELHIPDSNQTKYAEFIIKVISSSNLHLTTSDYEDPEDVLEQAQETGKVIYSVKGPGLNIKECDNCQTNFKFKEELTKSELKILDSLSR